MVKKESDKNIFFKNRKEHKQKEGNNMINIQETEHFTLSAPSRLATRDRILYLLRKDNYKLS